MCGSAENSSNTTPTGTQTPVSGVANGVSYMVWHGGLVRPFLEVRVYGPLSASCLIQ